MNKVIALGNLASDVTLRQTQTGKQVASFKLAVTRRGENAGADFFWVKTWNGSAEACAKYLSKGSEVLIEGSINTSSKKNDDGSYTNYFEVNAPSVKFLRPAKGGTLLDGDAPDSVEATTDAPSDDEIPF
jgi:single-strand DNA-binding protein